MSGLDQLIEQLENAEVTGELWVDGSFTTQKIDPEDVDLLLCVDGILYDVSPEEKRQVVDGFESPTLKTSHHCDSYVLREYPQGHLQHGESLWMRAYWIKQFGFSRDENFKGILTLQVRGISEAATAGDPYAQLVLMARQTSRHG
jgi:uncharacterized protein DUF6932